MLLKVDEINQNLFRKWLSLDSGHRMHFFRISIVLQPKNAGPTNLLKFPRARNYKCIHLQNTIILEQYLKNIFNSSYL